MKNRALLHRARQKSRRQVTVLSRHASRKRCQGCGKTNYFHRIHTKKCDFCPSYFSTHRKTWDQVRLDLILGGQVWGDKTHSDLRRPLFFGRQETPPSSTMGIEESLTIPGTIAELNRLQARYNRRISAFMEAHYKYQVCGPMVFIKYREPP